ncbi:MAG: glycosyltransferase family 2 protein [Pseudomonadota bacterium]
MPAPYPMTGHAHPIPPPATQPGESRRFSVIIVHRNGRDMLLGTLDALFAALDGEADEVFLVDNGSSDGSVAAVAARHPAVRIIENGCNHGFARANNQAIALARGRYLLLLNSDTRVEADILTRLDGHFGRQPDAGIIGASLVGSEGEAQHSSHQFPSFRGELGLPAPRPATRPTTGDGLKEADWVVGACMAVRAAAVDQAGPLEGAFFFYYEDVEWCLRMRRHGWRVFVAEDVRVTHLRGRSTLAVRKEALIEQLSSRLIYYRKAFGRPRYLLLFAHRLLRLTLSGSFWGTLNLITLGRRPALRARAQRYLHPLSWILAGRPDDWGLPDKCPYDPKDAP